MLNTALEGARNLLLNCADVRAGDRLLILHEDPALGWYDVDAPILVAQVARALGVRVTVRQVGGPDNRFLSESADAARVDAESDCCIFFARIGDQLRFDQAITGRTRVMSYVTSLASLASHYGCIEYQAMADLKKTIDGLLLHAAEITISCPLGTGLRGRMPDQLAGAHGSPEDVTVLRFPIGVHVPVDACGFSGKVRLARYLTPTGSRVYDPSCIAIDRPLTAEVIEGRIVRYVGDDRDVYSVQRHYRKISEQFSLNPDAVLSWHAGIHPGCRYEGRAAHDPDRWSNTVFTNPRFVHFHTCGNAAPGEICWMVLDPTICVDGVPLWDAGALQLHHFVEARACLQRWPGLQSLFANGNGGIGL